MRIGEIARQIDGVKLHRGDPSLEVDDVVFDSRKAREGALFAALRGAHADGHDYVWSAIEQGATAVFVERGVDLDELSVPVMVAEDTRRWLGAVSAVVHGFPSRELEVVGVTGTNGKTTTTWILESLLAADDTSVGVIGTVKHRWPGHEIPAVNTTPESAEVQSLLARMRDDGVGRVAMEVSSHGLATHRLRGTAFDVGVFTNLSQDHLDFHESMEAYFEAKKRLFTELLPASAAAGKQPTAVVNVDDEAGQRLEASVREAAGVGCVSFGRSDRADYRICGVESSLEGASFGLQTPSGRVQAETPLIGDFNVMNTTAAVAAAVSLGVSLATLTDALRGLPQIPGRMERVGGDSGPAVFVDYAHSPDALERALQVLRPLGSGRLIVVFGAGGDRDRDKRPAMGAAAREHADRVVVTSDNPRGERPGAIIDDILSGCGTDASDEALIAEEDRERAIAMAVSMADAHDIILVAGKGHETYQEIGGERRPFDDREVVRRALDQRQPSAGVTR